MAFDPSTTKYIYFQDMTDAGLGGYTRSVAAWVNLSSLAGGTYIFEIWKDTKISTISNYSVGGSFLGISNFGHAAFGLHGNDGTSPSSLSAPAYLTMRSSSGTVSTGTWIHIAATFSSSLSGQMYINGAPVTSSITNAMTAFSTVGNGNLMAIVGNSADLISSSYSSGISGQIASISYHSVTLTASEIADAYAHRAAIVTTRGLVFAPNLWARGEVGEGGALTSSYSFLDLASLQNGYPANSPTYKQDTILNLK